MCQFATPLSDDIHTKPEVTVYFQTFFHEFLRLLNFSVFNLSNMIVVIALYIFGVN